MGVEVHDQVRNQLHFLVLGEVLDQVEVEVNDQVENQMRDQVFDQVLHQMELRVLRQVELRVLGLVLRQVRIPVAELVLDVFAQVDEQISARWEFK